MRILGTWTPVLALSAAFAVAACSSPTEVSNTPKDSTSDSGGADIASGDVAPSADVAPTADATATDDASSGPSFHKIFTGVMAKNGCSGKFCHGAANPPAGLHMNDEATAYAELVNHAPQDAAKCKVQVRVKPGDHAASLMWQKVAPGVAVCGGKMPDGTEGLTQAEADEIAAWIDAGAPK